MRTRKCCTPSFRLDPISRVDPLGLKGGSAGRKDFDYSLLPSPEPTVCGVAHNITVSLLVFQFTLTEDDCSGLHATELGVGIGTPGVSSTYSVGGDSCIGIEVSGGFGQVAGSGEVGIDSDATLGAGADSGVGIGLDDVIGLPDVGIFSTWGCDG